MSLSTHLLSSIKEGSVVLFLGAGASVGAIHKNGNSIPNGQELAKLLADKFLDATFANRPLSVVAELAMSESDLFTVQTFIRDVFLDFQPADFHKLIPTFAWKAIASTNYDLIIERSYQIKERIQDVVVFKKDGENVDALITKQTDIQYLKLHGCISNINDRETPLILTPDQYITHRKNREHLFGRLKELWYNNTFLFVGQTLLDSDLRIILNELDELKDAKPRSFIIIPGLTEPEKRLYESKKITPINLSFKDLLLLLDGEVEKSRRVLAPMIPKTSLPILRRFNTSQPKLSGLLTSFLEKDVEFLCQGFKTTHADPKLFYKGYFQDWGAIEQNLDVKREIADTILYEVIIEDESMKESKQELIMLNGHAGSGKTVVLKRIAWDAAMVFDKFCLSLNSNSIPEYDALLELYSNTKQRIFLFIDSAIENKDTIVTVLERAKMDSLPITIISTERINEWNERGSEMDPFVTRQYTLEYLKQQEIIELVKLLANHKSLGHLETNTFEEQVEAFSKKAGRQILVALHEATEGSPFEEIIRNEYNSIQSQEAKKLYLSVCILHRLEVTTRAGLISRVHGISFDKFRDELFKPLEQVVFAKQNNVTGDFSYVTRHPHIAELVFSTILIRTQDRYDEYMRIFNDLDTDYSSDLDAFVKMAKAKHLMDLFSDPQMIRQLYAKAELISHDNYGVLQQEAIFEMHSSNGNLEKASALLNAAIAKTPWNNTLRHSLAELSLKKYEGSKTELERHKYKNEAIDAVSFLLAKDSSSSYPYHTLLKLKLAELEEILGKKNETVINDNIKDIERHLSNALQKFPDDSFLLEIESRYNTLVGENPKAIESLSKAFASNKRSPYIAIRLSNILKRNGEQDKAIDVLKECIEANPVDKDIHFRLSLLLMETNEVITLDIKHHLRNSFTKGDTRYEAQFWYARALYLLGETILAKELFLSLNNARVSHSAKNRPQGIVMENGVPKRFNGTVSKVASSYCYIVREGFNDDIFAHADGNKNIEWYFLKRLQRTEFTLAFNFRGPIAIDTKLK